MIRHLLIICCILQTAYLNAQTFFSEDFSSGIPGGWVNIDNSGNGIVWKVTTTGAFNQSVPVDAQLNPNGTSATNGYLILDSDSAGSGISENTDLITTAINCTGHSSVRIAFNEYFAQYGSSTGTVYVSNDAVTWTAVHQAETGLLQDQGTPNPNPVDIDISATAANQATVYIRFTYTGMFDYWWMIDDVKLYEPSAIDIAADVVNNLSDAYTIVPLSQATGFNLSGVAFNAGLTAAAASATYEIINTTLGSTVFSETVSLAAINPGATVPVIPAQSFIPAISGVHKARITVSAVGDGNVFNDTAESDELEISDSVYARDDGNLISTNGIGAGPGEDGICGQNFQVNAAGDITSVSFFFDDTLGFNPTGTPVYFSVRSQLNDTTAPDIGALAYTDTMIFFPGNIPAGGSWYTLPLSAGNLHVLPGLYYIGLHEVDSILPIGIAHNIITEGATWVHWNSIPSPTGWVRPEDFGMHFTYMIRANFLPPPVAVDQITDRNDCSIYPNPASSAIHINRPEAEGIWHVSISDVTLKCIYQEEFEGTHAQISLNMLPEGIFLVTISDAKNIITRKVIHYNN